MINSDQMEKKDNEFVLPYQSPQVEKQIEILRAYCILSEERKKPVEYKEVADFVGISDVTVSGNHKFFVYCGFLEIVEGNYLPSEKLLEFVNKLEWKKLEEAKKILRELFEEKWFTNYLSKLMRLRGKITNDEITNELGAKIGAKRSQNNLKRLYRLFEWILYSGMISESSDNTYELKKTTIPKEIKRADERSDKKPEVFSGAEIESQKESQLSLVLAINITPETTKEELEKMIELARQFAGRQSTERKGGENIEKDENRI